MKPKQKSKDFIDEKTDITTRQSDIESDISEDAEVESNNDCCDFCLDALELDTESEDDVEQVAIMESDEINDLPKPSHILQWTTSNDSPNINSLTSNPGLLVPIPEKPLGFIQLFITRELLEFFTFETNLYAKMILANKPLSVQSDWIEVEVQDIAHYLGLSVLMGVIRLPSINMYWGVGKKYFVPAFPECMTLNRYKSISRYFHTYNKEAIPLDNNDRLIQISTVMNFFIDRFKNTYVPERQITIDEGSMAWRGRLSFKAEVGKLLLTVCRLKF